MLSLTDIKNAWEYIRLKNAAGGIDLINIEQFASDEKAYCLEIYNELKQQKYLPEAYLQIKLKKNKNEYRTIALATLKDKIVQQAIRNKIEPIIDQTFSNISYAYRKGKGARKAINRIRHIVESEKKFWIAKCDIDNFFDTLNHDLLFKKLQHFVKNPYYLELIKMFVKMGYVKQYVNWQDRKTGVPQGAILSPLLSNLYLDELDKFTLKNKISYVRYADDFVIISSTEQKAKEELKKTIDFIQKNLLLKLNKGTYIRHINQGFKYLGLWITKDRLSIDKEKIEKLKNKIQTAFNNPDFPQKYYETLAGINNYYGRILPEYHLFIIDEYIKELWKNKVTKLKKLRSKKAIKKQLKHLKFLTDHFNRNFNYHRDLLIDEILQYYKKQKITDADKAIAKRKKQYEQKSGKNNHIHISGYGLSIGMSKKQIRIKSKGKIIEKFNTLNIKTITISSKAISVSGKFIEFCAKKNIPVDFTNNKGEVYAKLFNPNKINNNLWLEQQKHINSPEFYKVAIEIAGAKIKNQQKLIKYFSKYALKTEKDIQEILPQTLQNLNNYYDKLSQLEHKEPHKFRQRVMAIEGLSSAEYWHWFRLMIDEETDFENRKHQGATDLVNSMLNYAYAILYRHIWTGIIQEGLYPGFSYIHAPHKKKGTLIFDLIETFRQPVADRAIISLINRKSKLEIDKNGLLTPDTKQKLIKAVNSRLTRFDTYQKERTRMLEIINRQTKELKKYILKQTNRFKAYQMSKW